jgi:ketosteroid isomerase-like protein
MADTADTRDIDARAVEALVEEYRQGFATLDPDRLLAIWDPGYDVVYSPIERVRPVRGVRELERYFRDVARGAGRVVEMEVGDLTIDVLGDVAYAFFTFRFAAERPDGGMFAVEGRNTLVARRVGDGWKGIHWHESVTPPGDPS